MDNRVWLAWETHQRNRSMSAELSARLFELNTKSSRLARYLINSLKTLVFLNNERPSLIFVQNPSIVLTIIAIMFGKYAGIPVIVDAHNAGIYPFEGKIKCITDIATYLLRKADFVIVTNEYLASYINKKGIKSIVLPDPIPKMHGAERISLQGKSNILFICSFADDEPYQEVIKASGKIRKDINIYITGNSSKKGIYKEHVPDNVILTGFMPEEEFNSMLHSVDIIMDLTTRDNCLVCGAYEATAVGKPMILSDSKISKEYFYKGAIYTDNSSDDIAAKVLEAIKKAEEMRRDINDLKKELEDRWTQSKHEIENLIENMMKSKTNH